MATYSVAYTTSSEQLFQVGQNFFMHSCEVQFKNKVRILSERHFKKKTSISQQQLKIYDCKDALRARSTNAARRISSDYLCASSYSPSQVAQHLLSSRCLALQHRTGQAIVIYYVSAQQRCARCLGRLCSPLEICDFQSPV